MNVKNLKKSTKLSEFLKLHSVLKFTTCTGKHANCLGTNQNWIEFLGFHVDSRFLYQPVYTEQV